MKKLVISVFCSLLLGCSAADQETETFVGMVEMPAIVVNSPVTGTVLTKDCSEVVQDQLLMQVVTSESQVQAAMAPTGDLKQKAEQATVTARAINEEANAYLAEMTAVYRRACSMQARGLMSDQQLAETKKLYLKAVERQQKAKNLCQQVEQEAEVANRQVRKSRLIEDEIINIKAPAAGVVTQIYVAPGQTVLAGMPLCEIEGKGSGKVFLYIEGAKANKLKPKQKVSLYPQGTRTTKSQKAVLGIIARITPVTSGSIPQLAMEQGLYQIEIETATLLPEDSLVKVEVNSHE